MIIQFFGLLDVIAATFILFGKIIPESVLFYVAGYLLLKGILFLFSGDFASIIDILIGLYVVLMIFGFYWFVASVVCALFLYQKGLFSFL